MIDIISYIIDTVSAKPRPNPLERHENFVAGSDIYILDTFNGKSNMKNAAFVRMVNNAIKDANHFAATYPIEFDVDTTGLETMLPRRPPRLWVYINCPDTDLNQYAIRVIDTLCDATANGVSIQIKNVAGKNDAFTNALQAKLAFNATKQKINPSQTHTR